MSFHLFTSLDYHDMNIFKTPTLNHRSITIFTSNYDILYVVTSEHELIALLERYQWFSWKFLRHEYTHKDEHSCIVSAIVRRNILSLSNMPQVACNTESRRQSPADRFHSAWSLSASVYQFIAPSSSSSKI